MDTHFRHNAKPSSCDGSHTHAAAHVKCKLASHKPQQIPGTTFIVDPAHTWPDNLQCCLREDTMPLRQDNIERTMRATIRLQTM